MPGDASVDARVPGDEPAEDGEERCRCRQRYRRRAARQRPDKNGRRGEERRQAQTRDARGAQCLPCAVAGVARRIFRVWNRTLAHAACSEAAGLVAARFRRQ